MLGVFVSQVETYDCPTFASDNKFLKAGAIERWSKGDAVRSKEVPPKDNKLQFFEVEKGRKKPWKKTRSWFFWVFS